MYQRPFLKWPGGKFRLLDKIIHLLPERAQLVEPFVGSGVVFLNTEYESYQLSDVNPDLISLYQILKDQGQAFIDYAKKWFTASNNQPHRYYTLREEFNRAIKPEKRAALFLYLNRHGFNGLCRYNQQGIYNVPFGQYKKPYFPEEEMKIFAEKSQRAVFSCSDFRVSLNNLGKHSAVYADPPYVPLSASASFTQYAATIFGPAEQSELARLAQILSSQGVAVLLSNHDMPITRSLYAGASFSSIKVLRSISAQKKGRSYVKELLAFYKGEHHAA